MSVSTYSGEITKSDLHVALNGLVHSCQNVILQPTVIKWISAKTVPSGALFVVFQGNRVYLYLFISVRQWQNVHWYRTVAISSVAKRVIVSACGPKCKDSHPRFCQEIGR